MATKYMKTFSTSLSIKEMRIKTALRFPFTPVRMTIINNTNNNKCWWGCRKTEPLATVGGNVTKCNHCGKQYGGTSK
jgi:hypothetical protein